MEPNHKSYPLDSSAAIHIASINGSYSNFLRLSTELLEQIDGEVLQKKHEIRIVAISYDCSVYRKRTNALRRSLHNTASKEKRGNACINNKSRNAKMRDKNFV